MIAICGTQVYNDDISKYFFHFLKLLIFLVVMRVKRQKMAKNKKKLYPSHSISQEAYIIWSWFLVHRCKMKKSPKTFSISSKFWFSGLLEGQKMAEYDKKFCLSLCLRNCTSYCGFWYTRVKSWYLQQRFSCFQNSDFPGVWGVGRWGSAKNVKKMQKMTHNYQF